MTTVDIPTNRRGGRATLDYDSIMAELQSLPDGKGKEFNIEEFTDTSIERLRMLLITGLAYRGFRIRTSATKDSLIIWENRK